MKMKIHSLTPNSVTYSLLLGGLLRNYRLADATGLIYTLERSGLNLDIDTYNCVLDGLCKAGELDLASELFGKFSHKVLASDVTYNITNHGFSEHGHMQKANNLFLKMKNEGCAPNLISTLMQGFCNYNKASKVVELLHKMAKEIPSQMNPPYH